MKNFFKGIGDKMKNKNLVLLVMFSAILVLSLTTQDIVWMAFMILVCFCSGAWIAEYEKHSILWVALGSLPLISVLLNATLFLICSEFYSRQYSLTPMLWSFAVLAMLFLCLAIIIRTMRYIRLI